MKLKLFLIGALASAITHVTPIAFAQEVDGSDIEKQLAEREGKISKLTPDEQLKLRAAQKKAAEDPATKAAFGKRNEAMAEFRNTLSDSMVKADPGVKAILKGKDSYEKGTVDTGDVEKQLAEQGKIRELTLDEQLKVRAAQQKAAEDPAVKTALEKRNAAIEEFRKAFHDSMVKADPALEPILEKIAVGTSPGF